MSRSRYPLVTETTITVTSTRTLVIEDKRIAPATIFELCTFKGGRTEVYVYVDGLAEFRGYYDEIAHTALAAEIHSYVVAHVRRHSDGWARMGYLPGAVSWL